MVSSFHPHNMCKKVERVTVKIGCTSCTKRTVSFEVSGFYTETRVLQKGFHFFELIWAPYFFSVQNAPFKATSSIFNPFWLYVLFFMRLLIILSYKTLKLESISNELWKGWKLAWYHHFIHIACARKLRGLRQKLDALRVQNGQSLSKYQDFIRKLVCYKGISFFKTYLNSWLFVCSKCTIQSHIIIFQSFLTSFVIFHAFTNYFEL